MQAEQQQMQHMGRLRKLARPIATLQQTYWPHAFHTPKKSAVSLLLPRKSLLLRPRQLALGLWAPRMRTAQQVARQQRWWPPSRPTLRRLSTVDHAL